MLRCALKRLGIAALFLGAAMGWAQTQDMVKLRSSLTMSTDDNFFRTGSATAASERITTQSMGINVSVPLSLQRFELDASLNGNQHQTYSNFDYTGQNYNAAWYWGLTPQFHGSLTTARLETLNAASDSLNPNLRNKNTTNNTAFNTVYELGGPWQLSAGVSSSNSLNERAVIGQGDNRTNAYNAGFRYAVASGSSLGYSFQSGTGSNTNDFTTTNHTVNGVWAFSGNTSLNARLTAAEQRYAAAPQFDFSGLSGGVGLIWQTSGKTSLNAGWTRDLTSNSIAGSTYTRTDALTLAPVWQASAKTTLRLQYRYALVDDQGNTTGMTSARQDRLQDTSFTLSWEPRPFASLSTTLTDVRRTSNGANLDYVGKVLSVAAQFTF